MNMAVAQLGARMHYAVPSLLHRAGNLEHFFTDSCADKGWPQFLQFLPQTLRPGSLRSLLGRAPGLPSHKVTAFNNFGLRYAWRRRRSSSPLELTEAFLWAGQAFCKMLKRQDLGLATHVFSYNSAGLEWMRHAKARGLKSIMEQTIAPKALEEELLAQEHGHFPDWEPAPQRSLLSREYAQREAAEWEEADMILCGSQFVKDGIQSCGGPAGRCVVLPYGVDIPRPPAPQASSAAQDPGAALRVLTVGAVGLRKGSPYVLEAAKVLKGVCEFRMVGPLTANPRILRKLSEHVDLVGPVPRSEVHKQYAWAQAFFLPSICEGSATVIYEALAHGLPVITTDHAGAVVEHGVDGWVTPIRQIWSMIDKLALLHREPDLLRQCSNNALRRSLEFSREAYGQRLLACLAGA